MSSAVKRLFSRKKKSQKDAGTILGRCWSSTDRASTTITYAYSDVKFVRWLHDALRDDGRDVWVDWETSPPNAEWIAQVYKEIESNDVFILVLSPDLVKSDTTDWAVDHAIKTCKKIIPVVFREVAFKDVRPEIAALDWIFFREDSDDWPKSLKQLTAAMDKNLKHTRYHAVLLTSAVRWETEDFEKMLLLDGPDLKMADDWLSASALGAEPKPTTLHMSYINSSKSLRAVMAKRRLIAFFFFIMVVIAIIWPSWGVFFFALVFSHIFVYFSSN